MNGLLRPTLVEGAYGTRGRYQSVCVIPYEDTPVGTYCAALAAPPPTA